MTTRYRPRSTRRRGQQQTSLGSILASRLKPWQQVLVFIVALTSVLGGVTYVERTYGVIGGTMGWLRIIDMVSHTKAHDESLKQATAPITTQLTTIKTELADIAKNRTYADYKQTLWQLQALQAKKEKGGLTWQEQNQLVDLQIENERLLQKYKEILKQEGR